MANQSKNKNAMKVSFVSTNDFLGGAARATYWLASGLRASGLEVTMLVDNKFKNDSWIEQIGQSKIYKAFRNTRQPLDSFPIRFYSKRTQQPWSLNLISNAKLLQQIEIDDADIVNLHWIGNGFFPLKYLKKLNRPIVWSLYDMWSFTGGCHYDDGCSGYMSKCKSCPQLGSETSILSQFILSKKVNDLADLDITIVSPSKWLAEIAGQSTALKNKNICVIPHGTDLSVFKPIDKNVARNILNLNPEKTYILFASTGGVADARKGYQYLSPAIDKALHKIIKKDIVIIILGDSQLPSYMSSEFDYIFLGKVYDDTSLSLIYSASDLVLTPSRQEAFGMTASEAMACGTPVVAFATSGVLDVVDHKSTGYLAKPFCVDDFAEGIAWCLNNNDDGELSLNCTERVAKHFDLRMISQKYTELYRELINR
jgi:glycosyltransferase involved in cell wall biosynthesis